MGQSSNKFGVLLKVVVKTSSLKKQNPRSGGRPGVEISLVGDP